MYRHPFLRLFYCVAGSAFGIALALHLAGPPVSVFFLASLGGSTVFLFGLTRAPAAQPRALFGGHLIGAAIGIGCYQTLGDAPWVYAVAQGLALGAMLLTRTVHPPAGTNPILMIYVHASWSALDSAGFHRSCDARDLRSFLESPFPWARALSNQLVGGFATIPALGRMESNASHPATGADFELSRLSVSVQSIRGCSVVALNWEGMLVQLRDWD